jgi:hypothetical protein
MVSGSDNPTSPEPEKSEPVVSHKTYLEDRKAKLAIFDRQAEFLDKHLLTLSAGGLGLTLTFLHDHGDITTARAWVYAGMGLLIFCMFAVLLSIGNSQRSISVFVDAFDEWCAARFRAGHASQQKVQGTGWVTAALLLNRAAMSSFLIGVSCIAIFVTLNLSTPPGDPIAMSSTDKNQPSTGPLEKSATLKPPPVEQKPAQPQQEPKK